MTITVAWPAMVLALVGALVYLFAAPPAVKELGRLAYFAGLFWVAARLAAFTLSVR